MVWYSTVQYSINMRILHSGRKAADIGGFQKPVLVFMWSFWPIVESLLMGFLGFWGVFPDK